MFALREHMVVSAASSAGARGSVENPAALLRRKAARLASDTLLGTVLLCLLTLLLSGCGGSGSSRDPVSGSGAVSGPGAVAGPTTPVQGADDTLALRPSHLSVAKEGDLVALTRVLVRQRAELRKSGALESYPVATFGIEATPNQANPTAPLPGSAVGATAGAGSAGDTPPRSGTTVQEAGVEEDDLLKTDGRMLYGLQRAGWGPDGRPRPDRLHAFRRQTDGTVEPTGTLDLATDPATYTSLRGLVLAENEGRLALFGEASSWFRQLRISPPVVDSSAPRTTLQWVDVSGAKPIAGSRLVIDGRLVGIRQTGRYVYLALSHTPRLAADLLPASATPSEVESRLASLKVEDILPQVRVDDGAARPLLRETDCFLQAANRSSDLQLSVVLAFDAAAPASSWRGTCFFGGTQAIYMSPQSLYLATSRHEVGRIGAMLRHGEQSRTDVHKFRIRADSIAYRGSGEVAGHLGWDPERAAYRMSEEGEDLRVLTFTGSSGWMSPADIGGATPPSPATLTVLREDSASGILKTLSTLPNATRPAAIGLPGEQVYAVRFQGNKAYLVTFRQTDPLYVLDLSNPADPKTSGELKMPGYSDYLFPLPNGLLFGVGKDASIDGRVKGVKAALFDVRDPSAPKELRAMTFGDAGSSSGLDFSSRGINLFSVSPASVRIALPMALTATLTVMPDPLIPPAGGIAMPGLPSPAAVCAEHGLQLLEVDTATATLTKRRWMASSGAASSSAVWGGSCDAWQELPSDRSVQIGNRVYYWTRATLRSEPW
ncbi:MAG: hypothetical protein FJY39_03975 [Betaproteobacteria bacterium]|nr:hypothetical protein [Betaproteobacteria bacterium]